MESGVIKWDLNGWGWDAYIHTHILKKSWGSKKISVHENNDFSSIFMSDGKRYGISVVFIHSMPCDIEHTIAKWWRHSKAENLSSLNFFHPFKILIDVPYLHNQFLYPHIINFCLCKRDYWKHISKQVWSAKLSKHPVNNRP